MSEVICSVEFWIAYFSLVNFTLLDWSLSNSSINLQFLVVRNYLKLNSIGGEIDQTNKKIQKIAEDNTSGTSSN